MKSLILIAIIIISSSTAMFSQSELKVWVAITVTGCENDDQVRDFLIDEINTIRPEVSIVPSGYDWKEKYEFVCKGSDPKSTKFVDTKQDQSNNQIAGYNKTAKKTIRTIERKVCRTRNDLLRGLCQVGFSYGSSAAQSKILSYQDQSEFLLKAFNMNVIMRKFKSGSANPPKIFKAPANFIAEHKGKGIDGLPVYTVFDNQTEEIIPAYFVDNVQVLPQVPLVKGSVISISEIQKQLAYRVLRDPRTLKEGR